MKKYLFPQILRRGYPTLTAVKKEKTRYWLLTYYDRKPIKISEKPYKGFGYEYLGLHSIIISKELYKAFSQEIKRNKEKFKIKKDLKK